MKVRAGPTKPTIASEIQSTVRSHGGIQGVIHSVFFGASPSHFQLRELSTGKLVKCIYSSRKQYDELAMALKQQNAIVHVFGTIKTDLVKRQIEEFRVDKIEPAESFSKEDFARFIGCAPGLIGDQGVQDFIDYVRERELAKPGGAGPTKPTLLTSSIQRYTYCPESTKGVAVKVRAGRKSMQRKAARMRSSGPSDC